MTRPTLLRAAGLVAIMGGALRAAASFAPVVIHSDIERESLYVVVDLCLSIGLVGFNARHSKSIGWPGAAGLALALVGFATVRANRAISTVDLYPAGALAIACGVILLSARAWVAHQIPGWVPVAFLLSTLVGLIGSYVRGANALFVWSGVIFGVAFAGLGVEMWKSASNPYPYAAASVGDSQPERHLLQPHSEQNQP
jgi:hypothetical protein